MTEQMTKYSFEKHFKSDICEVRQVISDILSFVENAIPNLTDDDRFDIRLIFSELLVNAITHGNRSDARKSVYLYIEVKKQSICAKISDEGAGFDYLKLMNGFNAADNFASEHGRGVRLVHSLTDNLTFNVKGNELRLVKRLGAHE